MYTDAAESRNPTLVSGDVRDGWWEVEGVVRRLTQPRAWGFFASAADRIHRQSWRDDANFMVKNANADVKPPAVTNIVLNRTSVDVRTEAAKVTVTAHITDDKSGLRTAFVALNSPPNGYNRGEQATFTRVSGTNRVGDYRAVITVPKGSVSGRWNLSVSAYDGVSNSALYAGPEMVAQQPGYAFIPIPSGRVDVVGTAIDTSAPVLTDLVVDRTEIDTLPHSANVTFDVYAGDVGDGVEQVTVSVIDPTNPVQLQGTAFQPVSGTKNSGIWRVTVTFPQGAAPGRYVVDTVMLWDRTNIGYYVTPGGNAAPSSPYLLAPEHYRTTAGAIWDGSITVIDNPAGAN